MELSTYASPITDNLLRVKEVCSIIKVNRMTLYRLMKSNALTFIDINKNTNKKPRYRILESSVEKYIKQHTTKLNS